MIMLMASAFQLTRIRAIWKDARHFRDCGHAVERLAAIAGPQRDELLK
jgi:hypothetical protein